MVKFLMPYVAEAISSASLLRLKRNAYESVRRMLGRHHVVDIYLNITDPYSYLLIQVLPRFLSQYPIKLRFFHVLDVEDELFPERDKWCRYSLQDAGHLAELYQVTTPQSAIFHQRSEEEIRQISCYLASIEKQANALELIREVFIRFWTVEQNVEIDASHLCTAQLVVNQKQLQSKGHYLSATLNYAGEWYWGIDRLLHLEKRLKTLMPITGSYLFDRQNKGQCTKRNIRSTGDTLEMFFSARSPYSYLGLERAIRFCRFHQLKLVVKPVLPMMMRGLAVPKVKKMYIFHDAKREAEEIGVLYGKVADPLGKAVENCYALFEYAQQYDKQNDLLLAFSRGVNSQGTHGNSQRGLGKLVTAAGLDWQQAKSCLQQQHWRQQIDENMQQLSELGMWGVPCFRYKNTVVWGQDRLWVIEKALLA